MFILSVNVSQGLVIKDGIGFPITIEDDMEGIRSLAFSAEDVAYAEYDAHGENLSQQRSQALFHRFTEIWEAESAVRSASRDAQAQYEREEFLATQAARIQREEERQAKAMEPIIRHPAKSDVLTRMTDTELVEFQDALDNNRALSSLWNNSDRVESVRDRIVIFLVAEGFVEARAEELLADLPPVFRGMASETKAG